MVRQTLSEKTIETAIEAIQAKGLFLANMVHTLQTKMPKDEGENVDDFLEMIEELSENLAECHRAVHELENFRLSELCTVYG